MKNRICILWLYTLLFFVAVPVFALDIPPLRNPVNDCAKLFTAHEYRVLTNYITDLDNKTHIQIAVLTIPSLEGNSLESYSIAVAEKWKIGQKEKNSGVIILIAAADRKIRIEVGYGLEPFITDAHASKIIRTVLAPYFSKRKYGEGVKAAVHSIAALALQDEQMLDDSILQNTKTQTENLVPLPILIVLLVIYGLGIVNMRGGLLWPVLFFAASNCRRGYYSRFSGSSFSESSFSGFSGGGGSFGGGGASGSW